MLSTRSQLVACGTRAIVQCLSVTTVVPCRAVTGIVAFLGMAMIAAIASAQDVTPVEFNASELVEVAVKGSIAPARLKAEVYRVGPDGEARVYPGTGSITYNFRVGDSAVHLAADHVEPSVSVLHSATRTSRESVAFNVLACIGNVARVVSGDAKGAVGTVIGKHGGAEHVMVEFDDDVYDKLVVGDDIQIRALGTGMQLSNVDDVRVMNASPRLIEALTQHGLGITGDGRLRVPVTHHIPAKIMGSGLGRNHVFSGDYDIQLFDAEVYAEHGLDTLRFGDIVAILDADHTFGRIYRTGAVSVGVVVHSISFSAGHGPGVTTLFTSSEGNIEPVIDSNANLATLLELR